MSKPESTNPPDDLDLMLRHDGELSADERRALDAAIAGDEQALAKLEALDQVSGMVRGRLELAADDAAPRLDALWSQIESAVVAEPAAAPATAPRTESGGGLWDGVREWMDRWRSNVLTGAVAAAAAALIIMAVQRPDPGAGPVAQVPATGAQVPVNNPPEVAVQETLVAQPPVVESLEVVGGSGTVLSIPGDEGENPTTVIWVTADDILEDPI